MDGPLRGRVDLVGDRRADEGPGEGREQVPEQEPEEQIRRPHAMRDEKRTDHEFGFCDVFSGVEPDEVGRVELLGYVERNGGFDAQLPATAIETMIRRSDEFVHVALYLSRCGQFRSGRHPLPPVELGTHSWATAYAMFFDALGGGRTLRSFKNSLKASRDQFDSHVNSGRVGWREGNEAKSLPARDANILQHWQARSDGELWRVVRKFADLGVASLPKSIVCDLDAEPGQDDEVVIVGREGRVRAVISRRRERSLRLRGEAFAAHGYGCQVCGFSFERVYGEWGRDFAEVHHMQPLSEAPLGGRAVNPRTDLAVLCANCHRMIHRRAGKALTLDELRAWVVEGTPKASYRG